MLPGGRGNVVSVVFQSLVEFVYLFFARLSEPDVKVRRISDFRFSADLHTGER
jgi:hypothetical protein